MSPNIDQLERLKIIAARINEGRDSYAGRQDAWHQLGNVEGDFHRWKDLIAKAYADFPVVKMQLFLGGHLVDAWGTFRVDATIPKGLEGEAIKISLPDGDKWVTLLGTVGKDYQVIQHTEGFELMDHLVGQIDGAHYETMGMLDFGRIIFGQVDPSLDIRVGDDIIKTLLSFHTSHDGSRAFDLYETMIRMVCRNTWKAGSLKRLKATMRVRHSKNAQKRIDNLKAEIDEIKSVAMSMQDRLTYLSQRRVTKDSLTTVMNRLFPMTKNDDGVEESSGRRDNILASILERYENNDGNAFPEQRGTAYNLFNSVVEYSDHFRSTKGDGRAESAVFGSGDKLKTSALDLIIAEAEKMPAMRGVEPGIVVDWAELGITPTAAKN